MTALPPDLSADLRRENARLQAELRTARDRQAGSAEILRAIAATSGDAERSLWQIAEITARLFGASSVTLNIAAGDEWAQMIRVGAGSHRVGSEVSAAQLRIGGPNLAGTVFRENRQIHIPNVDNPDPAIVDWPTWPHARAAGTRAMAGTPLRREGKAIGVLIVHRDRPVPFTAEELALQQSFADQAVIAVENARLFNETEQALARQTATSDILRVISQSPTDVQPVFDAIVLTAVRLLGCDIAFFLRCDAKTYSQAARATTEGLRTDSRPPQPIDPDANFPSRAIVTKKTLHLPDWSLIALTDYERGVHETYGIRASLYLPLFRAGECVGLLVLAGKRANMFGESEIALAESFRDQALIAIENTRLFNETQEALERQTATADILKVIASSPSDTTPVFQAIATSASRLLGGFSAAVFRFLDGRVHLAAFTPVSPVADAALKADFPKPVDEFEGFQLAQQGKPFPITDTEEIPHPPELKEIARLHGFRSMLFVPLMNGGVPIGIISVTRLEPGAFAPSHIQLLQTFGDQAVIAIENTRLFNETREALERQTATADILKVIASSPSDVQPVFDVIVERAVRLCGARMGRVYRYDDGMIHMVAGHGLSTPGLSKVQEVFPRPAADDTTAGFAIRSRRANFVTDIRTDQWVPPLSRQMIEALGTRSQVTVPMLRTGEPIGAITVGWAEPAAYGEQQVALLETFADQAVIAIENVRLFNETREALERQTATADILKVIASSPSDVQPVFEAIATSANRLIGGFSSTVFRFIDGVAHLKAFTSTSPAADEVLRATFPRPVADFPAFQMAQAGEVAQIPDTEALSDELLDIARARGFRSMLFTPLMNDGVSIGFIVVTRVQPGAFADHHVQLLRTFADQAVIAIENVRLFDEVQAKTRDLTEALTYQTGSSNILRVIASSPTDVEPVLKAIVESACELCEADDAVVHLREGDDLRSCAHHGPIPVGMDRRPINRNFASGRAAVDKVAIHLHDVLSSEGDDFPEGQEMSRRLGIRTVLSVPLLRESESLGTILLRRTEVKPFSDKQIALLQTFADQAVIAIGNVRLFDEVQAKTRDLTEALTYQTGSGNILKVIASSPTDVQPVLKAIVESACELCQADDAIAQLRDGDDLVFAAHRGSIPVGLQRRTINPNFIGGRAVIDKVPVHLRDVLSAEGDEFPESQKISRPLGTRTLLCVPLLREGESIGTIVLRRTEVKPFSDKQIALLQTFADQAVIAIGNVRLFDEVQAKTRDLTEALTYQTGSSNILRVIASSPTDVGPVLKAIVESACELCEADDALVTLRDGDDLLFKAQHGSIPVAWERMPINRQWASGRAVVDRKPVHVRDLHADEGEPFPDSQELARRTSVRTVLSVPLLRENESIGAIVLRRTEVQPFSDKQISLLQTFADQAVIAIDNVRLFDEVQARTADLSESLQQQTATADVLKVISRSTFDLKTVLDALIGSAAQLCDAHAAHIYLREAEVYKLAACAGFSDEYEEFMRAHTLVPGRGTLIGRTALEGRIVRIPDALNDPQYEFKDAQSLGGFRTMLGIPMLRDGAPIGVLAMTRSEVRPFTDKQIDLVTTFADQAVIAIENVRLFVEVQERTRELSQSLDDLRTAQDRLVQTEKLASLGQLTAGIAHEIKNPLNFVNNFSALSAELTDELNDLLGSADLSDKLREEVDEITHTLKDNLQKVVQHGKRADSIVKNMLLHSREGSGEHRPADINAILDESLNLAYHGARAEKREFNVTLQRDFDETAGTIEVFPQEITRVFLNLISNGFYAVTKRKTENGGSDFEPVVRATTRSLGDTVEIRIRDNGTGIPAEVKEKMFNPFFTTKPAGEGTGLGLSMSHDIIVKQHGGRIDVETEPGEFTEFRIVLPRTKNLSDKNRGQT